MLNKTIAQAGGSVINDTFESVYNIAVHCAWGDDDAIDRVFTQLSEVIDKVLDADSLSKLTGLRGRLQKTLWNLDEDPTALTEGFSKLGEETSNFVYHDELDF